MATREWAKFLSARSYRRKPSAIRQLQPLVKLPGMISLGGGMPNPSLFPIKKLSMDIVIPTGSSDIIKTIDIRPEALAESLQYSPSYGIPSLVHELKMFQRKHHDPKVDYEVMVTTGSQDAIGKAFDMLLDENDTLLIENPSYSGSLAALNAINCKLVEIETDKNGLIPEDLETKLKQLRKSNIKPKALYVIPTGQNPSGSTLTSERKQKIYDTCDKFDIIILEDDPYWYLRFDHHEKLKSFLSIDRKGIVLRFDSFSKIISSGLRMGFVTGNSFLVNQMMLDMQASELHASGVSQILLLEILKQWGDKGFHEHISNVQIFYKTQRDNFIHLADKYLANLCEYDVPSAGMFVWLKLKGIEDSEDLIMKKATEKKVLLVPGKSFIPSNKKSPYVRASYSTASFDEMEEALKRLRDLLHDK